VLVDATGVFKQHKEWRISTRRKGGGLYFGRGSIFGEGGGEGAQQFNFQKNSMDLFFVVYFVFFWTYLCSFEPV